MKKLTAFLIGATTVLILSLSFISCQKDNTADPSTPHGMNKVSIFLTDGPTDYEQVLVDIQSIAIKIDTCRRNDDDDHDHPGCDGDHDSTYHHCEIWDTLSINAGVYDLLTLRNGVDTLLASDFVLNGKIERIKFTLGNNNSVVVNNTTYPLNLVGGQHYVYVDIHREHIDSVSSNNLQLFLDFDLQRSIKYVGGQYWLKPVLKPFSRHGSGEIEGKIRPVHSHGIIKAYNSTDSAFAWAWNEGEFKIRGLHQGVYSLFIDGINGYQDSTITNITVQPGHEVELGTIQLHQ